MREIGADDSPEHMRKAAIPMTPPKPTVTMSLFRCLEVVVVGGLLAVREEDVFFFSFSLGCSPHGVVKRQRRHELPPLAGVDVHLQVLLRHGVQVKQCSNKLVP